MPNAEPNRARIPDCDPTAVCFLFDTTFPGTPVQMSKIGNRAVNQRSFHPESKRLPSKIRYARPLVCQGGFPLRDRVLPRRAGHPQAHSGIPRPLSILYSLSTPALPVRASSKLVTLSALSKPANAGLAERKAGTGTASMHSFDFRSLLLIPLVLAIAFMVWVFWNFGKDYNRH